MAIYGKDRKSETDLEIGITKKDLKDSARQKGNRRNGTQNNTKIKENSRTSQEIERKGGGIIVICHGEI